MTSFTHSLFAEQRPMVGSWPANPDGSQMEGTECGAASLSIILQHFGKYVPLTTSELCGVSG